MGYPTHDWTPPARTRTDAEGNSICVRHGMLMVLNAITLADYCPACSYEPGCDEARCYCRLFAAHPPPRGAVGRGVV